MIRTLDSKEKEIYYIFTAPCLINPKQNGDIIHNNNWDLLRHNKCLRYVGKYKSNFKFEAAEILRIVDRWKRHSLRFNYEVFLAVNTSDKTIRVCYFDKAQDKKWVTTPIDDEEFIEWEIFTEQQIKDINYRLFSFIAEYENKKHPDKLEIKYFSKSI